MIKFLRFGLLLASLPTAIFAQPADEILITARGRAETRLRVPDSVTVLAPSDLAAQKLRTIDDVIAAVPGVYIINDQDPGTNIITMRGVSTNRNQVPSIAYVVDGLALPDVELFTLRPFDLARVEILKGPQGALYGRSASAGVISLSTAEPASSWGATAQVSIGNGETYGLDATINAPVSADWAVRLSGSWQESDGFIRNSFLNKKVDGFGTRNFRAKIKGQLSDALQFDARFGFADEDGGAAYISSGNIIGNFGGRLAGRALTNPFGDFEGRADRRWWQVAAGLRYEFSGGGRLEWRLGFDDYHKNFVEELDFRNDKPITFFGAPAFPDGLQPISQPVDLIAFTQELRYTSPDTDRLRWIAGLFFQDSRRDRTDDFGPLLFGGPALISRTRSTQFGLFAQTSYDFTANIEATAAIRYDRDDRRERLRQAQTGTPVSNRSSVFDHVQPKVSLAWRPTNQITAYVTGSVGFKAGGFNPLPGASDIWRAQFPQETTKALEAGIKAQVGPARISLAGYTTDYENFQNTVFLGGNSVVLSIPQVNVRGLEADVQVKLSDEIRIEASAAFTRSKAGRYFSPNPTPEAGEPAIVDYSGKRTPNAPTSTWTIGAQWDRKFAGLDWTARADYRRVGKVYYEIDNLLYSPSRGSIDARLAAQIGSWTVEIWGKNITNERWAVSAFGQQQLELLLYLGPGGPFDSFTINPGRQYGASVMAQF
jgi:iron complex outermembrane recepter protein